MTRLLTPLLAFVLLGCGTDEALDYQPLDAGAGDVPDSGMPDPEPGPDPALTVNCAARSEEAPRLKLTRIAHDLSSPVYVTSLPDDANELYVLTRPGTIRVIQDGKLLDEPFLDIKDQVFSEYVERGLLGLAFHPDYRDNGRYFIHYVSKAAAGVAEGDVILAEYRRSDDDRLRSNPEPEQIMLHLPQPSKSHKGSMMMFDHSGYLFLSLGNGGSEIISGETDSLLGKLLRLDVDSDRPYAVPPGNMEGFGVRPEIWDYGFRNPWRYSIDRCTGALYITDVGDGSREEVNVEAFGDGHRNYGYPVFEGDRCRRPDRYPCKLNHFTKPVVNYDHEGGRCAIIGGFVYRGHAIPGLLGTYLYTDHCSGQFWAFEYDFTPQQQPAFEGSVPRPSTGMSEGLTSAKGEARLSQLTSVRGVLDHREITDDINPDGLTRFSSFGQDARGEIYVTNVSTGSVYRVDSE